MTMTTTPTGAGYVVVLDSVTPVWVAVPSTAASPGIRGQMAADATFFYACIAANTWVRAALATW